MNDYKHPLKTISIILILSFILLSAGCVGSTTPPQPAFELGVGESHSYHYKIDKNLFVSFDRENDWKYADSVGYLFITTTVPGTYHVTMTTETPSQIVSLFWKNTRVVQSCDKFSCIKQRGNRWSSIWTDHCTSDRMSDCSIDMVLDDAESPVLEVWLIGMGSGNITITRKA